MGGGHSRSRFERARGSAVSSVPAVLSGLAGLAAFVLFGCADLGDPLERQAPAAEPLVEAVVPDSAAVGDTIQVVGRDFGIEPGSVFLGRELLPVSTWADSLIEAILSDSAASASLEVRTATAISNRFPFRVIGSLPALPELSEIVPTRTVIGDTVSITGFGFGEAPGVRRVYFRADDAGDEGEVAAVVVAWTNDALRVLVPVGAVAGDVAIGDGARRSNAIAFDVAANVIRFSTNVRSILRTQGCEGCHINPGGLGNFSVITPAEILQGGDHGPAAIPRRGAQSLIVRVLRGPADGIPRMPDGAGAAPSEQILVLQDWIDQGMRDN